MKSPLLKNKVQPPDRYTLSVDMKENHFAFSPDDAYDFKQDKSGKVQPMIKRSDDFDHLSAITGSAKTGENDSNNSSFNSLDLTSQLPLRE